jgi:hypothetical protein
MNDLGDPTDPGAMGAFERLRSQLELTIQELRELLTQQEPVGRLAAVIATLDLLERLREWQQMAGPPVLAPTVLGVEATQSVQFFRPPVIIAAPAGRTGAQPENDLPLVAGKSTVLRAYIQNASAVSGTIEWRSVGGNAWSTPLAALNAPVNPPINPIAERGLATSSLNFRLPADACQGDLEVRASFSGNARAQQGRVLWDSYGHAHVQAGVPQLWNASTTFRLVFRPVAPLGIRLVRMRYAGRGLTLAAPSVADFWRTATMLRRTYPLSEICLWRESEELYDGDFSDITPGAAHLPGTANGGSTGDWLHIMNNMIALENAPNAVRYVMLYPTGAVGLSPFIGWGVGRTALTPVDNQSALAHEVGHLCGRPHAPCGGPAAPDPWYPTYGGFGPASIGEFGVDVATLDIMDPATTEDFMSYCAPTWISPYQYEHIRNWLLINPGPTTCIETGPAPLAHIHRGEPVDPPRERLALTLQIYRNGHVSLSQPSFHVPMNSRADEGVKTDYFVELRNVDGNPLTATRLFLQDANLTLDDALTSYLAFIPWDDEATEVVVLRGSDVLQRFPIEANAPRISKPRLEGATTATARRLSWTSDIPAARFAVRYSPNGGDPWRAIATWLEDPSCAIDLAVLPSGEAGVIEILASAGFRTSRKSVKLGRVAPSARVATIVLPASKHVARVGETVVLLGYAISKDGEAPCGSLEWSSSRDGVLGSGRELLVHTLSPGRHVITLSAEDGIGAVTRATRTVSVEE